MNDAALTKDWLGRTRRDEDEITLGAVQRLAATLDQDPTVFRRGSEMPESWYAILFTPIARESTLQPDGHLVTGDFLPPLHGTRRMFAGRRTKFIKPLKIGDMVRRVSTLTRAEPKTGRTGSFTLVTVVHEISGPAGLALTEEQDIVYRAAVETGTVAAQREAARVTEKPTWSTPIELDPVLVFRYSALTFNAHRIHYDLPYARDVEGYPALVMNGGLTALLLIETARPHLSRPIIAYAARALSPLFVGQRVVFNGRLAGDTAALWASGPDDGLAYRVDVTLAATTT
ncbi:MAG TPA: MaoC family dehydratase N-terminal domain-containing protein [Xanthobacteraceae bacterium]|nr:MaoC family dehydratase N-terminal domain-containing protein [Xanthobacteraceae bacterium]